MDSIHWVTKYLNYYLICERQIYKTAKLKSTKAVCQTPCSKQSQTVQNFVWRFFVVHMQRKLQEAINNKKRREKSVNKIEKERGPIVPRMRSQTSFFHNKEFSYNFSILKQSSGRTIELRARFYLFTFPLTPWYVLLLVIIVLDGLITFLK